MKILCICNGGNVRSTALARYIKDLNGIYCDLDEESIKYEAISVGKDVTTKKSMDYFKAWADYVIDVSDDGEHFIGKDVWNDPTNKELVKKMEKLWKSVEEHL